MGWKRKVGKDKTSETSCAGSRDGATSPAPKLGGGAKGLLAALKAAKNKEEEHPSKQKEEKITGTKMLFAMSANRDEDNQKVKVWFQIYCIRPSNQKLTAFKYFRPNLLFRLSRSETID